MLLETRPAILEGVIDAFLQDYAETMWLKPLSDEFIKKEFMVTILQNIKLKIDVEKYFEKIFAVFKMVPEYVTRAITLRDLQNLIWRFICLAKDATNPAKTFVEACISEFAYGIDDIAKRRQFVQKVEEIEGLGKYSVKTESPGIRVINNKSIIPSGHKGQVAAIEQDIAMRDSLLSMYQSGEIDSTTTNKN